MNETEHIPANNGIVTMAMVDEVQIMLQTLAAERPVMVATWGNATHLCDKLRTVLGDNARHFNCHELDSLVCIDKIPDDYLDMLIIDHTHAHPADGIELDRALPAVLRVLRASASVVIFNRRDDTGCPSPEALTATLQQHCFDNVLKRYYLHATKWQRTSLGRMARRLHTTLTPSSGRGFMLRAKKSMTTIRTIEWDTPAQADEQLAMNAESITAKPRTAHRQSDTPK